MGVGECAAIALRDAVEDRVLIVRQVSRPVVVVRGDIHHAVGVRQRRIFAGVAQRDQRFFEHAPRMRKASWIKLSRM